MSSASRRLSSREDLHTSRESVFSLRGERKIAPMPAEMRPKSVTLPRDMKNNFIEETYTYTRKPITTTEGRILF